MFIYTLYGSYICVFIREKIIIIYTSDSDSRTAGRCCSGKKIAYTAAICIPFGTVTYPLGAFIVKTSQLPKFHQNSAFSVVQVSGIYVAQLLLYTFNLPMCGILSDLVTIDIRRTSSSSYYYYNIPTNRPETAVNPSIPLYYVFCWSKGLKVYQVYY